MECWWHVKPMVLAQASPAIECGPEQISPEGSGAANHSWSGGRDGPALFKQWSLNNHLLVFSPKTLYFTIFREQTSGWPQGRSRVPVYPWWSGVGGTTHCPHFPSFHMPPSLRDLGEGGADTMPGDGISEYVLGRLLSGRRRLCLVPNIF